MVRALDNWERLVRATLHREQLSSDGRTTTGLARSSARVRFSCLDSSAMVGALDNWKRLVRAILHREQLSSDGRTITGLARSVHPSLVQMKDIDALLQASDDLVDEDTDVARILCEQAYALSQNLDPNSDSVGMLRFKTGLMSVIKQKLCRKKNNGAAIDRTHEIERLWNFYIGYKKRHQVDDFQKEQQRLMESRNFSANLGEMEGRVVQMEKVSANLRAIIDIMVVLGRDSSTGVDKLVMEEVQKIKISGATLGGEFTPYNFVRLDEKATGLEYKGSDSIVGRKTCNEMSSIILFSKYDIESATNCLSDSSKIGQGGYGAVYRGYLGDTKVAIKMLDPNSKQGIDEFLQELDVLGRMRHQNLVKLIGACFKLRSLVYEFLPNGSLGDCLRNTPRCLTWRVRMRIVHEICLALIFLHSNKPEPVVHGDLKPANILLDAKFNSKLADFGLCRFIPEGTSTVVFLDTQPKGTFGYIDPEFMKTGILTPGCDMYSFGVTILRLLTGMEAIGISTKVRKAYKEKSLMTLVDPTAGHWPADVSEFLAYFGLKCCARKRSSDLMKEIARDLEEILDAIGH